MLYQVVSALGDRNFQIVSVKVQPGPITEAPLDPKFTGYKGEGWDKMHVRTVHLYAGIHRSPNPLYYDFKCIMFRPHYVPQGWDFHPGWEPQSIEFDLDEVNHRKALFSRAGESRGSYQLSFVNL